MSTKNIAAIFLADRRRAAELAESLTSSTIDASVANSSDEFYQLLNYQRVDVVVIEHQLPGFLTGLDILERLYVDLLRPSTILLASPTSEVRDRARQLGLDTLLAPDSTYTAIKDKLEALLTQGKITQIIIQPDARRLVQRAGDIPPLPQLLVKLSTYLGQEDVSLAALADDISVDPRVTADLLRLINSSAMGFQRKITKVFEAVNLLGVRRTISLILAATVIESQTQLAKNVSPNERTWYNRRSVLIASAASTFARNLDVVSPDTAYVLGLLQDIGILVMARSLGSRYSQLLHRTREVGQLRLHVVERDEFGMTHADVSAAVLQKWAMPSSIISTVLSHHTSAGTSDKSKTEKRFLHLMRVGEALANLTDGHVPQRYPLLAQLLGDYAEAGMDRCRATIAESVAKAVESSEIFSVPIPSDRMLEDLVERIAQEAAENPIELMSSAELDEPMAEAPRVESALRETASLTALSAPPTEPAAPANPERPRVLVIEDEFMIVELMRRFLNEAGMDVTSCDNMAEALRLVPGACAVLADIHLGQDNGIQIVKQLRSLPYTGPIMMVSGDRSRESVGGAIMAGATDFLVKPFTQSQLLGKLRTHLGSDCVP